jgi:O-antigen/teichoic acid export membrane protein
MKILKSILPVFILNYFKEGNVRSAKIKRNVLATFIIKGLGILVGLIAVPLTIHYINPTRYGIWITLSSMMAWFGYFDIGLGNGLRNRFAEAVAAGEYKLARTYISTSYAILSIFIGVILVLFFCINPFLNWSKILNTPADMETELFYLVNIVFILFCIQFVLQLITSVYIADQKPAKASLFQFSYNVVILIVIYILTKTTTGNLLKLGVTLSLTPVIVYIISSVLVYKTEYKIYAPSFKFIQFKYARDLLNLGVQFFIIQVMILVVFTTSNLIIAQLFGPAQVTPYNIAYQYFSLIIIAFSIIITPFWSAYTEAYAKLDFDWIKRSVKNLLLIWVGFIFLTILMILLANFAYKIWVGKEINIPIQVTILLGLFVTLWNWNIIFTYFLNGTGKIRLQLYYYITIGLINIPLAVFLGKEIGIPGVIWSMIICLSFGAIISPIQYYKIINGKANGIWAK